MTPTIIEISKTYIAIESITKNGNAFVTLYLDSGIVRSVLLRRALFNAIMIGATIEGAIVEQQLPDKYGNITDSKPPMKIFKTLKF